MIDMDITGLQKPGKWGAEGIRPAADPSAKPAKAFSDMLQSSARGHHTEKLENVKQALQKQGEYLAEHRTLGALQKYKDLVRQFLKETVETGFEFTEEHEFSNRRSLKLWKPAGELEESLLDLSKAVFDKEKTRIDVMEQAGIVKGLLVHLYA